MRSSRKLICTTLLSLGIITTTFTPNFASESKNSFSNIPVAESKLDNLNFKSGAFTEKSKEAPEKIVEKYYSKDSGKKAKKEFKKVKEFKNSVGNNVIKTVQTYKGIPVYGADQNYHVNEDGVIVCIAGSNVDDIAGKLASSDVPAGYSLDSILTAIEKDLGFKPSYVNTPKEELILFPVNGEYKYAYKVNLTYDKPTYDDCTYYIDAGNLSVLTKISNKLALEQATVGSGVGQFNNVKQNLKMVMDTGTNTYYLKNTVDNIVTIDSTTGQPFSEPDSFFNSGNSTNLQKQAVDAHNNLQNVVNYFRGSPYMRNGYDNEGSQITIQMSDSDSFNAYAFPTSIQFEAGKGAAGRTVSCGVDAVAHEYTHVMLMSEGLDTSNTILHEALADVFATLCEKNVANDGSFDWSIGEDTGEIFRNCAYPKLDDYTDYIMNNNPGVAPHIKGGVITKAAYLIAEGGVHNDYSVTGLGYDVLANIFYHAINDGYFTTYTNMESFASVLLITTDFLYGTNSTQLNSVRNALYAVGLGLRVNGSYSNTQYSLTWAGTAGFNYGIYRKYTDYTSTEPDLIAQTTQLSATVDVLPGSCNFYVAEIDSNGNRISPFSNPVTLENYQYTAPANFYLVYRGGLAATFGWTGETGVSYGVFRKPTGSKLPPYKLGETTNSSLTVDTLIGSYDFYVAKVDASGARISPLSNVYTLESFDYSPSNFSLTSTNWSQVNLSWLAESGVRYGVYRKPTGSTEVPVKLAETTNSYASVHTLLGSYDFYVAKIDSAGYRISGLFNPITVTVKLSAPTNLTIDSRYQNSVFLSWQGATRGAFDIYTRPTGSTGQYVKLDQTTDNTLIFDVLVGSNDYCVVAVDRSGYNISDFSAPITIVGN